MNTSRCDECGAVLTEGTTCRDHLNTMIAWDFEDFLGAGQVHHLTVLCYNLQHPRVYSKKGLTDALEFLNEFVNKNVSFAEHDLRNRKRLSSGVREWKITGTEDDHGSYSPVPAWTIRASDVALAGREGYVERVNEWSRSVSSDLRLAGILLS